MYFVYFFPLIQLEKAPKINKNSPSKHFCLLFCEFKQVKRLEKAPGV